MCKCFVVHAFRQMFYTCRHVQFGIPTIKFNNEGTLKFSLHLAANFYNEGTSSNFLQYLTFNNEGILTSILNFIFNNEVFVKNIRIFSFKI